MMRNTNRARWVIAASACAVLLVTACDRREGSTPRATESRARGSERRRLAHGGVGPARRRHRSVQDRSEWRIDLGIRRRARRRIQQRRLQHGPHQRRPTDRGSAGLVGLRPRHAVARLHSRRHRGHEEVQPRQHGAHFGAVHGVGVLRNDHGRQLLQWHSARTHDRWRADERRAVDDRSGLRQRVDPSRQRAGGDQGHAMPAACTCSAPRRSSRHASSSPRGSSPPPPRSSRACRRRTSTT